MQTQTQNDKDSQLRGAVAMQIDWEPEVMSRDVAVSAREGVVTLTGFVDNYYEKIAAERAAKSVYGVRGVANDLEVKTTGAHTDPEIARDVVKAMMVDVMVPDKQIEVTVKGGYVTLEGNVNWHFQRSAAAACAHRIAGVKGVHNEILVKPSVSATEVEIKIENALKRSAEVDARRITVTAHEGTVHLYGNVRSFFEREEAERAAWAAPGVSKVEDHILIAP
jgi:osmotically-inducible protein OsmY